jgi:hypothetical protein
MVPDDRVTVGVVVLARRQRRVLSPVIADDRSAVDGRNLDVGVQNVADTVHGLDLEHRAALVGRGLVNGASAKVTVDLALLEHAGVICGGISHLPRLNGLRLDR